MNVELTLCGAVDNTGGQWVHYRVLIGDYTSMITVPSSVCAELLADVLRDICTNAMDAPEPREVRGFAVED